MNTISFSTEIVGSDTHDGWVRRSVSVSSRPERVYYLEAPLQYADWVSEQHDFLLVLIIHFLMEEGGAFHICGAADARLLAGLEEYSRIWHLWRPKFCKPLRLSAQSTSTSQPDARGEAIAAFSGGVDAAFNLCGHEHGLFGAASQQVRACLFLHGADILLEDQAGYNTAFAQAQAALQGKKLELIPLRTNIRTFPHDWEQCFNDVVVAALMMFSRRFACGSCGAGAVCRHDDIKLLSHNYITDHLLYPSYFSVYIAGATTGRTERCAIVARDPALLRHLRVCYQEDAHGLNCGRCEKCQRTMLNFMAAGYTGPLPFPEPFSLRRFMAAPPWSKTARRMHRDILEYNDSYSHALPPRVRRGIRRRLGLRPIHTLLHLHYRRALLRLLICLIPAASLRRRLRARLLSPSS